MRNIKGVSLSNCNQYITNIKKELFFIITGNLLTESNPLFNKKMCEFTRWYKLEFDNNIKAILQR